MKNEKYELQIPNDELWRFSANVYLESACKFAHLSFEWEYIYELPLKNVRA